MADQDQITKLNAQIQELNSQLSGKPIKIFDVNELNEAERVVKSLRQELQEATSDISGLAAGFKNVVQEMQKTSKPLEDAKRSFNVLSGLAQKLQNDQVGINKLSKNELISIQDKIKAERENQKTLYTNLKQKYEANSITDRELAALVEIEGTLANENVLYNDLLATSKKRLAEEIKIQDAMGLGGAIVGSLKSALDKLGMGGLVDQLGIKAAEEAMEKVADEVTKGGTETSKFGGKVKVLKAGMGSLGESIKKNLTDPLFIAKFLTEQFIKAMKAVDKAAGDLAKSMNISYQESVGIMGNMNSIANSSNSIFITSTKLAETQIAINKYLGTSAMLTNEQLVTMTKLREAAGFTNEEIAGIAKISFATGKEMKIITGEVLAQAQISSLRKGVVLNEREVLKDISKVSSSITLSLGKNPKAIAEAVATAKSLGMELSKVDAIAGSILNFESSIENELAAELLIGKELNLERARFAALNNDFVTVATEIAEQAGTAAEFGNMSRIQQEALATAVGMNREELAQTLFVQEQLVGVSGEEAKNREKVLNARIKEVGLAQATQEIADGQLETLENQASVQEQLTALTDKLGEVFASLAPIILPILDTILLILTPISSAVGYIIEGFKSIYPILLPILGIMNALWLKTKAMAIMSVIKGAWQGLGSIPGAGPALAVAAILGGVGYINAQQVGDLGIDPNGGPVVSSPREGGLFQGTKNDGLLMGPGIGTKGAGGGGSSAKVESLLEQLVKKNSNLYMDSSKVADAEALSYSKL